MQALSGVSVLVAVVTIHDSLSASVHRLLCLTLLSYVIPLLPLHCPIKRNTGQLSSRLSSQEPVATIGHPLKAWLPPAYTTRQAPGHGFLEYGEAEQSLNRSMDVRQPHWATVIGKHANDRIHNPAWTAITLPLALDDPWLGIAGPENRQLLRQAAQPCLGLWYCQCRHSLRHKLVLIATMLVRFASRRPHTKACKMRISAGS
jgi:hypothetical protein